MRSILSASSTEYWLAGRLIYSAEASFQEKEKKNRKLRILREQQSSFTEGALEL